MILGEVAQRKDIFTAFLFVICVKDMYQIWIRFVLSISLELMTRSRSTMMCIADRRMNSYEVPEVLENQSIHFLSSKS